MAALEQPLEPPDNTQPDIPDFTGQPGLQVPVDGNTPLDYFRLFLTIDLLDHFVAETNRYAHQVIEATPQRHRSRLGKWVDIDRREMEKFLGLVFLMGLVCKPSIPSYWSKSPILYTPVFSEIMARDKFQGIMRFFHCNDNSQEPARNAPDRDRLYKIRPLVAHLQDRFKNVYIPDKFVAIDESLLLWKGKLVFKQYIPLKRARFGIKLFNVCEDSGYTHLFHIYTGKEDPAFQIQEHLPADAAHLTATEKIVVFMTQSLLDKGYHVYMDNWYSGIRLYQYMKQRGTVCCGTLRENRAPLAVRELEVSKEHPVQALRSGNLLFVKWQSSKVVYMLSTIHDERQQEVTRRGGQRVNKPSCVVSYNSKMGAVDRADQMIQPYDATRKTTRWYKKAMIHLLQVSMLNAFIVYKKASDVQLDFFQFQCAVINTLFFRDNPAPHPPLPGTDDGFRLIGRHFPRKIPLTKEGCSKTRRCRVCYKHGIRKETSLYCEQCPSLPPLCASPCFEVYHTLRKW